MANSSLAAKQGWISSAKTAALRLARPSNCSLALSAAAHISSWQHDVHSASACVYRLLSAPSRSFSGHWLPRLSRSVLVLRLDTSTSTSTRLDLAARQLHFHMC